ncbi:PREDICTED: eukaryotic translation initiation factor 4 gamma 3 isoform X2 [Rhagoletis zephyria]|nr:PREDICTED: eukaryotic translation initiation factor 4 gamma 3 isoform X2 [Rhagoletis zephyria]
MQAMYPQTMHQGVQSVVVQPFPQYQRQAFQAPPYAQYTQPMQPNYPYPYPSYYPVPAQRGAVGVSTGVGVGNTMSVQSGPNGPMTGPPGATQTQLPLAPGTVLTTSAVPPGSNPAVLGVGPSPSGQQVAVQSMVGVVQTTVPTQPSQKSTRRRAHALEIIDPSTNKNILEDFDRTKTSTSSDVEYTDQNVYVQQPIVMADQLRNMPYDMMEMHQLGRDVTLGQTPVVSAITDGPSVEILPPMQKPRSKKILPIVNPKDGNSVQSSGTQPSDNRPLQPQLIQQHQLLLQSTKLIEEGVHAKNPDCIQQQLPVSQQSQQQQPHQPSQRVPQINSKQQQAQRTANANIVIKDDFNSNISKECAAGDGNLRQQPQIYSAATTINPPISVSVSTVASDAIQNQNLLNSIGGTDDLNTAPTTVPVQLQQQQDFPSSNDPASQPPATFNIVNAAGEVATEISTTSASTQIPVADSKTHNMQLTEIIATEVKQNITHGPLNDDIKQNANGAAQPASCNGAAIAQGDESSSKSAGENQNNWIEEAVIVQMDKNAGRSRESSVNETDPGQEQLLEPPSLNSRSSAVVEKEYDETDRALHQEQHSSNEIEASSNKCSKSTHSSVVTADTAIVNKPTLSPTETTESEIDASSLKNENSDSENNGSPDVPRSSSNGDKNPIEADEKSPSEGGDQSIAQQSLINYNEGQWSPNNPTGKKQYHREQLLQLREAKASRRQPEVNNVAILPTPNLMPSFVRPKRVQSMVGSLSSNRGATGSVSGVDGGGNYGNKQASMSGVHARGSMKGMIRVNLSLNQDVKLNETDNAWRPSVLVKGSEAEADPEAGAKREKDELIRRVRGILNKLTPEKFDTLVEEIIKLKIDTPDKMEDVMVLVFEKAIDEPNFSVSYARLCHRLITEVKARDERMESGTKTNLAQFRAALLDKTEREFTQNVTKSKAKEKKLQPIIEKISNCIDPTEKAELEAQLEEEERKIRRRSGGTVRFIGELFKISMLTGKIINSCIEALLNPNSEDQLECMCKLLTTVGAKFEMTPINSKESSRCYSLDKTIARMQAIASKSDKEGAKVSSRVRFMLQDVIDLRRDKWQSKRNEAPKTMGQVEKEMKTEQLSSQYFNYAGSVSGGGGSNGPSSLGPGGKRDERGGGGRYNDSRSGYGGSHSQRGDTGSLRRQQGGGNSGTNSGGHSNSNNDDSTWIVQTSKGSRCLDTNKLEGLTTPNNFEPKKMGGVSQFIWSHGSRQSSTPTSTPTNSFAALSALSDTNRSNDRDRERDRDRSGPRSKGSYNKGSMERDRYGMHPRSGSSQASRESSSSRGPQPSRSSMGTSAMQKSASHSKYTQQQLPSSNRMTSKAALSAAGPSLFSQRGIDTYSLSNQQGDNSMSGMPTEPPTAVFEESSTGDIRIIKSVVSEMLEVASNSKTLKNSIEPCMLRVRESQRSALLCYIMTDFLHLRQVGKLQRRHLGNIVVYLIKSNFITREHFLLAYNKFCEIASDLALDIPDLWKYMIEFTGPLVQKGYITINDLWSKQLKEDNAPSFGRKLLKISLEYCLSEIGPSFTRTMWKKKNINWTDFMDENEVKSFIQINKFEYIENETIQPTIVINEPKEDNINRVSENVEQLLKEEATADCIIDYINGNVVDSDKHFIRTLATKLCDFAISYKENSYKLEADCFRKICIPVLHRYIDSKEEFELECLYSMQLLVARLEHPRGLLSDLFGELYDADVIPQDSFIKWRDSKDQSAGKGVAVKGLNPFFNHVLSSETSDENI